MSRRPRRYNIATPQEKNAEDYIREARYLARSIFPYYSTSLAALTIRVKDTVVSGGAPTFGVDKYMRMYAHPEAVTKWMREAEEISPNNPCPNCGSASHHKLAYLAGAVVHEMWHPLRRHHSRWQNIPNFQHEIGQISADCEINDDLMASFKAAQAHGKDICLPPNHCVHPRNYDLDEDLLMEEYYHKLYEKAEKGESCSSCGSGAGGPQEDWEDEQPSEGEGEGEDDGVPGIEAGELELIKKNVAQQAQEYENRFPGSVPAGVLRWSGEMIGASAYDWKRELSKHLLYNMSRFTQGYDLTTYRRASTLSSTLNFSVILPTYQNPLPEVAMIYDTSGSVNEKALKEGMSHGQKICKTHNATIRVVSCDVTPKKSVARGTMSTVDLSGGGGTDMIPAIEAVLEDSTPDVIIMFTDGFLPRWPEKLNRTALIVCLVGDYVCDEQRVPSWATTIRVT